MTLRVTQFGEPILREKGRPVEHFDDDLRQLSQDMLETMYAANGVGIAAQQVGHALLLFVVDPQIKGREADFHYELDGKRPPLELIMPLVVVNPVLVLEKSPLVVYEEGCLSFPGMRGDIERPEAVTLHYQDVQGARHVLAAEGWLSRILQHEYDHTQGVLFLDRMTPAVKRSLKPQLEILKQSTREALVPQGLKPRF